MSSLALSWQAMVLVYVVLLAAALVFAYALGWAAKQEELPETERHAVSIFEGENGLLQRQSQHPRSGWE